MRALFAAYQGNLYQIRRSDDTTKDIPVIMAGGAADAALQDAFCANGSCVITILYDQSGRGNHLEYQGPGSSVGGRDKPAPAASESLTVRRQKVYSLYINPGNSLQLLAQLLGELDEPKRDVFALVELEELTVPEAAAILQIPLNTAYSRLRAARRAFEAALTRYEARTRKR